MMTTIIVAVVAFALVAVAAFSIFFAAKHAAEAEAAQFVTVGLLRYSVDRPRYVRVALPPTCSTRRFIACLDFAVDECVNIFGDRAADMVDGARFAVNFSTKWRDNLSGQMVAGTALHGEVRVGSDLAALCHELVHVCQERAGLIDETHASWTPEIYAAIERYEAFARTVRE